MRLGERDVLRGVSADLGAREAVAVLGPNGSGKTTLFSTAMGLVDPDAGTVRVDGEDTRGRPIADLARSIGYVFQSPSQMLFARTVREELLFGPRNLEMPIPDPDAFALEALRRTGLADVEDILDRPPLTLSFGQQKRLAIAIGLALEPRTLILDEPSAGQDHRSAERLHDAPWRRSPASRASTSSRTTRTLRSRTPTVSLSSVTAGSLRTVRPPGWSRTRRCGDHATWTGRR